MSLRPDLIQYLKYVQSAGGNATIAFFFHTRMDKRHARDDYPVPRGVGSATTPTGIESR